MFINDLTDLDCEACGEAVDVQAEEFEPILPLLCAECLAQLVQDGRQLRDLPVAA
jgi:hypothetical protein